MLKVTCPSAVGPRTRWIVTDRPIYAFRVGLPVPPHLAVFSEKRWVTEELTEDQVIDTIREWQPEQVLMGRYSYPSIEEYLKQDYQIVHQMPYKKLYLRKELTLGSLEEELIRDPGEISSEDSINAN